MPLEPVSLPRAQGGGKKTILGRLYDTKNYGTDKTPRIISNVAKPEDKCDTPTCTAAWTSVHIAHGWKLCNHCAAERRFQ